MGKDKKIEKNPSAGGLKNSGQTLRLCLGQIMVEAMVALSVITVGILGVFTLTTSSIGYSRVAADRYIAVNLANEGMELTKNLIDKNIMDDTATWNYLPGFSGSGNYEIDYNDSALTPLNSDGRYLYFSKDGSGYYRYPQLGDVKTEFQRIINIQNISNNHIQVISTVSWKSRGSSYDFSVEDHFYNLKMFKFNNNPNFGG